MIFIMIYFAGLLGVSILAAQSTISSVLFFIALYTIALGTGGIKPNVSTFGADQFLDTRPKDVEQKASFFNW